MKVVEILHVSKPRWQGAGQLVVVESQTVQCGQVFELGRDSVGQVFQASDFGRYGARELVLR